MVTPRLFDGFRTSDFTDEIRGSTWRGRLAAPLKSYLETFWGIPCESQHVQYHNQMYVDFYHRRLYQAGFWLVMGKDGLTLRFRIERGLPEGSSGTVMTGDWDWHRFWSKLNHPTDKFSEAFQAAASEGEIELWDGQGLSLPRGSTIPSVIEGIRQFPERAWLNFWITSVVTPAEAIGWGTGAPGRIGDLLEGRKRLGLEAMSSD